jgi:hypothetical protein
VENSPIEHEINQIRMSIYEETKGMTQQEQKERLLKVVEDAQKEFGFRRVTQID